MAEDFTMLDIYLKDIRGKGRLTPEEEIECARNQDYDTLIEHNYYLAFDIASKFMNRGLSLEDLVQEANIGLITAAHKFDPDRGCRFSTLATQWIRQAITKALENNARTIRIPAHVIETRNKIEKTISRLTVELGRRPTLEEVGSEVGIEPKEVETIQSYFVQARSINETIGDDDTELGDTIRDTMNETPIEECMRNASRDILNLVLSTLAEREAKIVRLRILENKTLEETAAQLELSTERVRQLEIKALRKLRHPMRANIIKEMVN